MKIDTVLKHSYVVRLMDAEREVDKILWGVVEDDPSGRWNIDDFVCTSAILSESEGGLFTTSASHYRAIGEITRVDLPIQAINFLRRGISPDYYKALVFISVDTDADNIH